ncbi:hypothetical protein KW842_08315 [Duganella sp. sic0402]|uniref:hypothetical protein n=1 Tax=Duganella sp. sic0402 TaxID=2854786 RepID=UPI001C475A30|nr:hypothetical protein [Duganella sp. sic0402]MBV7535766.1 hypothetical protein [Duganella sp. sic0402]
MSARKSSRSVKHKFPATTPTPPPPPIDIEAMLMVGEERVPLQPDENDNVSFMAERIE